MGTQEVMDNKAARGWETLLNDVAEGVLELSDEDVLELAAVSGENFASTAASVRQLLLGEVKSYRQQRLRDALVEYQLEARNFRERKQKLPEKAADRRQLLSSILALQPKAEQMLLTLQHRDFKSLSDADVESLLKQLEALGVLPKEV